MADQREIEWMGRSWPVPSDQQLSEWMFGDVCETPDGMEVEHDHPDSWLVLLGVL